MAIFMAIIDGISESNCLASWLISESSSPVSSAAMSVSRNDEAIVSAEGGNGSRSPQRLSLDVEKQSICCLVFSIASLRRCVRSMLGVMRTLLLAGAEASAAASVAGGAAPATLPMENSYITVEAPRFRLFVSFWGAVD